MSLRIAMLSIHSSPMGRLGTRDTGGMSVYLRELSRALGHRGHGVDIFTRRTGKDDPPVVFPSPNVRIVHLDVEGAAHLPKSRLIDRTGDFVSAVEDFRRDSGAGYDLIHSHYWISGVVGSRLKAMWRRPHLVTFHTLAAAKNAATPDHAEPRRRVGEEARLAGECDGLIAPTEAESERLATLCGARREKVQVVPCGVDLDRFHPGKPGDSRLCAETNPRPRQLLFVGRFDRMKGIGLLLRSMNLLPSTRPVVLTLIGGDGPGSREHRRIRKGAGAPGMRHRLRLLGPLPHEKMPEHYRGADTVVVPSRYESFGLVILESLACGTPVAATRVGIAPDVIRPGVNGDLADSGDAPGIARAITGALKVADVRDPMEIRAGVTAFGWNRVASLLVNAYNTHLTANPSIRQGEPP